MLSVRPKAVAFDAYGTLVAIGAKRRPYASLASLTQTSLEPSPLVEPIDLRTAYQNTGASLAPSLFDELRKDLEAELASIAPYPEAVTVLSAVRAAGIRTAVASNLAMPYAAPIQKALGSLLDVECFSFEVGAAKPDLAFYDALCSRLALPPADILMVGDTWRCDYAGARAAGLSALHLDRHGSAAGEQRAVSLSTLSDLLPYLGLG